MTDFTDLAAKHADLPEKDQKQAGQAIAGDMNDEHAKFLQTLIKLLDTKEIEASNPQSLLKRDVYDALSQEWKDKVDLALINLGEQIRLIENFYRSESTPNSSPHLETMIEQLWVMKERIEKEHDVFKF